MEGEGERWGREVQGIGGNTVGGCVEILHKYGNGVVGKGAEIECVWLIGWVSLSQMKGARDDEGMKTNLLASRIPVLAHQSLIQERSIESK